MSMKRTAEFDADAQRPIVAPGDVLSGRYQLIAPLGRGGASVVFRARDAVLSARAGSDVEVAVKIADGEERDDLIALLRRETEFLRRISHPNVVRAFDAGADGAIHYLVLERLTGRSLTQRLRQSKERRLPPSDVDAIVRDLAAALTASHRAGVVHGDLKPGNVFITDDGRTKLLDFGAGRALAEEPAAAPSQAGLDAFTPIYASLEAIRAEPPTESDDVFSLSVLAYVLLSGRHPFEGRTAKEAWDEGCLPPRRPDAAFSRQWRALRRGLALTRASRPSQVEALAMEFLTPSLWERARAALLR